MGVLLPFSDSVAHFVQPLTEDECDTVLRAVYVLMKDELVNAVSVEDDKRYMVVYDDQGEPYYFGRTEYGHYMCGTEAKVVACDHRFEDVLEALSAAVGQTQVDPSCEDADQETDRQPRLASVSRG